MPTPASNQSCLGASRQDCKIVYFIALILERRRGRQAELGEVPKFGEVPGGMGRASRAAE
jgi:hypothetical protein